MTQDFERSILAEQNRQIIDLLTEMRDRHKLVSDWGQLKQILTPTEQEQARLLVVKSSSLENVFDTLDDRAKQQGYENHLRKLEHKSKKKKFRPKTEKSIYEQVGETK